MFGKAIRAHLKGARAFGSKVMYHAGQTYAHGAKLGHGIHQAMNIARQGLSILAPHLQGMGAGRIVDAGVQGIGMYDQARDRVMSGHEDVLAKIRQGGEVLDQLRQIKPVADHYM